ncbi:MAG: anthranilate phosphoribosyltransferase [Deltaproteobacteria bacterium]|nr:anthranilate phosphoribosyltransferase [Deltaproteobacteria bacterium]MDL1962614.1 anthranilate phosphoribosyltransferase [Deltaproteobacteria bacterium]
MDRFRRFGNSIDRLITGKDLSRKEAMDLFIEILNGEQTEIHQGAFLAAITSKGPTAQEIAGAWEAIYELDTVKVSLEIPKPVLENCGTGMDKIKTFNISTAAAIVAAAGGVYLARHGARAITSHCGTVDIVQELGIDVDCDAEVVKESIEKAGIGLFNGMSPFVHPHALFRILSQMSFGSILNIAASLANPANPRHGVRGVYVKEMVVPAIETMKEIGYKRAMVFHGLNEDGSEGMDEVSPLGENLVAELFEDGRIVTYVFLPDEAGIHSRPTQEELLSEFDQHEEALRLLRIFNRKDTGGRYKTICLNAAPIFYVSGEVRNLKEGFEKAQEIIDSGQAMDKLEEWVEVQNRDPDAGRIKLGALLEKL